MKFILGAFVLWLLMTAAAPIAEARQCAHDGHHAHPMHCPAPARVDHGHDRRIWRTGEKSVIDIPYEHYYPPMPASILDLPPDRDFFN